jgi:hypothetical protein
VVPVAAPSQSEPPSQAAEPDRAGEPARAAEPPQAAEPTPAVESAQAAEPTQAAEPAQAADSQVPEAHHAAEAPAPAEPTQASIPRATAEPPPAFQAPPLRPSLLPLAQPLWSALTRTQQSVLQPFEGQWNSWPTTEKRRWLALADRLPRMDADNQARARTRIAEWAALTPEQQRIALRNYRLAKQLPPDERKARWERYSEMTPEQQQVLRASGWTSNTAARHAGARTGLAKEAAQPLAPAYPPRTRTPN